MYLESDRPFEQRNVGAAFLAGGLIGVGIAVLLAPCSGAQTRARIAGSTRDVAQRFRATMGEIDSGIRKFTEGVDTQLSRVERLMRVVQDARESSEPTREAWQRSTVL